MKKYFLNLLCCCLLFSFSSFSQEGEFVIPKNEDATIRAEDGTVILGQDVYSLASKLKRKVTLIDPKSNTIIGEVFIRLESADADSYMYDVLEKEPERFSGQLIIESAEGIIYQRTIFNGKVVEPQSSSGRAAPVLGGGPGPVYNGSLPCTFNNIHNCVAYRIENLNWLQLGLCLFRAPVCYLEHWAFCTYDVCVNHMQYTNPN